MKVVTRRSLLAGGRRQSHSGSGAQTATNKKVGHGGENPQEGGLVHAAMTSLFNREAVFPHHGSWSAASERIFSSARTSRRKRGACSYLKSYTANLPVGEDAGRKPAATFGTSVLRPAAAGVGRYSEVNHPSYDALHSGGANKLYCDGHARWGRKDALRSSEFGLDPDVPVISKDYSFVYEGLF
jgi:prepilin-type processing-associated H-X9-DG protein